MRVADWVELAGAVALWRPAYRASLMKLSRSRVVVSTRDSGSFGQLKKWLAARQERREIVWTEADHRWLISGFVLVLISSAIKIGFD